MRMAITDTRLEGWDSAESRRRGLVAWVRRWASAGVEFLQLREKHLEAGELYALAAAMVEALPRDCETRLLVNGRADVAFAAGAHGVHLTAARGELCPEDVRRVFRGREAFVSVSCHTVEDVVAAKAHGADLVLFGPVFGKSVRGKSIVEGIGLDVLRLACEAASPTPVLALGGVDETNAATCTSAGAAGFAGIRGFSIGAQATGGRTDNEA